MKSGLRKMISHYPGRCKRCGERFLAGAAIYWSKPTGAICSKCGESGNGKSDTKQEQTPKPQGLGAQALPSSQVSASESYFTVDWSELRKVVRASVNDSDVSTVTRAHNQRMLEEHTQAVHGWHGYTRNSLKEWLRDGYKSDAMSNLGDFSPSLREKRRYVFGEDGEEIFIDRVLSGEDNYTGEWTKQERIPGAAVEAEIMFSSGTSAETVNAYNVWICKVIYALESAGIDCQVTLKFSSMSAIKTGENAHTVVRVKSENEVSDFTSFSPMLSPAALRTFGFAAMVLHADSRGYDIGGGFGRGRPNASEWGVEWDTERRVLKIDCPYSPRSFPAEKMEQDFRNALRKMTTNG